MTNDIKKLIEILLSADTDRGDEVYNDGGCNEPHTHRLDERTRKDLTILLADIVKTEEESQ